MFAALGVLLIADAWHYAISADRELRVLTTTVCVEKQKLPELDTSAGFADRWLLEKPRSLNARCARSKSALAAAADEERDHRRAARAGGDFVLSPELFFPVPKEGFAPNSTITATFELPPDISVLTPWSAVPGHKNKFRVPESTFTLRSLIVLGRSKPEKIEISGTTIEAAILDAPTKTTRAGVKRWLSESMRAAAQLYGRPPVDRLFTIVQPISRGKKVEFGVVYRGGGPTILFLLGAEATDDVLPGEWTAVHEMSHLALPFIEREHAWLSEGIASYYQNILRARAGHLTPQAAWQELHEGFERGRRDVNDETLETIAASMRENRRYMRIYWSGAAIALLADVELRAASKNARSLDSTLRALRGCCLEDTRPWTLEALTARLDAASASTVFSTLFQRHLSSAAFPALEDDYRALGLVVDKRDVRLSKEAPLAWVREAITTPVR